MCESMQRYTGSVISMQEVCWKYARMVVSMQEVWKSIDYVTVWYVMFQV